MDCGTGPSSTAIGYYVYRNRARIATLPAATFTYVDHNRPKGGKTVYGVTAFDAKGNEGTLTTVVIK